MPIMSTLPARAAETYEFSGRRKRSIDRSVSDVGARPYRRGSTCGKGVGMRDGVVSCGELVWRAWGFDIERGRVTGIQHAWCFPGGRRGGEWMEGGMEVGKFLSSYNTMLCVGREKER